MSEELPGEVLFPEDIRVVEFYGDEITGALIRVDGETRIYIPLRPVCDYLQLDWSSQRKRINRDEILASEVRGVVIMTTPRQGTTSSGGRQEMLCLPLDLLPGWLFGITTGKITDPALKEKIIRYRRECYRRLWEVFAPSIMPNLAPAPIQPQPSGAQLAYELATAVQNLAREQMELEARVTKAAHWAKGIEHRVTALELRLQPDQQISEAQAAELAQQVKTVAHALERKGGTNGYQRVYGELYRRYSIGTYRALPQEKFSEALEWLRAWYDELAPKGEAPE